MKFIDENPMCNSMDLMPVIINKEELLHGYGKIVKQTWWNVRDRLYWYLMEHFE